MAKTKKGLFETKKAPKEFEELDSEGVEKIESQIVPGSIKNDESFVRQQADEFPPIPTSEYEKLIENDKHKDFRRNFKTVLGFGFSAVEPIDYNFKRHSLSQVLDAINKKEVIDDIDIFEKIKEQNFRFVVNSDKELSLKISDALIMLNKGNNIAPEVSEMGRAKIKNNADSFAVDMYNTIQQLKHEKKMSTYRETLEVLNNSQIPTRRGGSWQLQTLQNLYKRWEKLGLTQPKPDQP